MLKTLLTFAIFLAFFSSCAPKTPPEPKLVSINLIDANNLSETVTNPERLKQYEEQDFLSCQGYKKVMRIYSRDADGNMSAYITTYHPNSLPKHYLEVSNGRACGQFKEWYENGQLKVESTVVGGDPDVTEAAQKTWLFDGLSKAYDNSGKILAEINYSGGVLSGLSTYYHPNGKIWKLIPYCQGMIEGTAQIFKDSGDLFQVTEYAQNEPHGSSIRYWTSELIASNEQFDQGRLRCGSYFDIDGTPITEVKDGFGKRVLFGKDTVAEIIEIKSGVPEGKVEKYSTSGDIYSIYYVKNGVKNGEEKIFYPMQPLRLKLSINWVQGKILGAVKTWYPNGQLESQKNYSDNMKNGIATAWYNDGSIMFMEEYEKDKLVKGEYFRRGDSFPITEIKQGIGTASLFDSEGRFLRKISYHNGKPEI